MDNERGIEMTIDRRDGATTTTRGAALLGAVGLGVVLLAGCTAGNEVDGAETGPSEDGSFTRVVNVETSEIVRTEKVRKQRDELYDIVVEAATGITRGLNLPPLPQQAQREREAREVPHEAVRLYSRALLYADRGNTERAAELFSQAIDRFPEYTEARQALQQLRSS